MKITGFKCDRCGAVESNELGNREWFTAVLTDDMVSIGRWDAEVVRCCDTCIHLCGSECLAITVSQWTERSK
jgi:hypothetical protein